MKATLDAQDCFEYGVDTALVLALNRESKNWQDFFSTKKDFQKALTKAKKTGNLLLLPGENHMEHTKEVKTKECNPMESNPNESNPKNCNSRDNFPNGTPKTLLPTVEGLDTTLHSVSKGYRDFQKIEEELNLNTPYKVVEHLLKLLGFSYERRDVMRELGCGLKGYCWQAVREYGIEDAVKMYHDAKDESPLCGWRYIHQNRKILATKSGSRSSIVSTYNPKGLFLSEILSGKGGEEYRLIKAELKREGKDWKDVLDREILAR